MENASKALLIAGAVLIVILIIGVGMAIYQGATGTITSGLGQMSQQEVQMFNQQFEQYSGTITGTQAKALFTAIISSDAMETKSGTNRFLNVTFDNTANAALTTVTDTHTEFAATVNATNATNKSSVVSSGTYVVGFGYTSDGAVCGITISRKT